MWRVLLHVYMSKNRVHSHVQQDRKVIWSSNDDGTDFILDKTVVSALSFPLE